MLNIEMELKNCEKYSELTDEMKSYLIDKALEHGTRSMFIDRGLTESKMETKWKLIELLEQYNIDVNDDEWKEFITMTFEAVLNAPCFNDEEEFGI